MATPYPTPPYGSYPNTPPPPRKKRRVWLWVLVAVVVLFLIGFMAVPRTPAPSSSAAPVPVSTSFAPDAPSASAADEQSTGSTIVYEVLGKGTALVTYSKQGFSQEQVNGAKLPFTKEVSFEDASSAQFAIVNAQHSTGSGDITCRITVDGKVVAENKSSGQYAVVSCTANG